ncbi:Ankyrin repeat protein [Colletotrichum scovillei]|uniref:Ankyrin repeat protein n=1 Tax=Colletotrichum scovillei TaxID=1209932 RepID=A0A9P7UH80_9PEZI|nr:Ankyrin repeat protein [Colletotrichum scovillei]KAG7082137.1 Ankyrin repeat protein [Colletotrichum scovillei]
MASLSSLGLNLRLADIDENLKSHPAALSFPNSGFALNGPSMSHDFIDDAPCFAYTEVFESGEVFQAVSPGSGVYLPLYSSPASQPAFTVSKSRLTKTIEIEYQSLTLLQSLAIAVPSPFDLPDLLKNYATLKAYLHHLENVSPSHPTTVELRLLVRDLLLDRALFAGIGTEVYRSSGILSIGQLHDMHQRSIDAGLDDLDACFALGFLPDVLDDAFLEALASKFTELALAGDLTALHDLCEPVVRTGEVEWQTNPDLLLELLDRGRLDIYRYVLDLASRTRDKSTSQPGPFLRDITDDPLHVAIRLGHIAQAENLLQQGITFLGVYADDEMVGGTEHVVLTPFSAAVYWDQAEIVRAILLRTPLPEGLREAIAIAVSDENTQIMEIMLAFGVMDVPQSTAPDDTFDCFAGLSIMEATPAAALSRVSSGLNSRHVADAMTKWPMPPKNESDGDALATAGDSWGRAWSLPCRPCALIWDRGLGVFRGLMQDSPPSSLEEIFDALLVANATYLTLLSSDDSLSLQFVDDLDRWRSVLPASSQLFFDELAFRM